ncbi:MAG: hypothetical protein U0325_17800 [Polyangiales bacterium]
MTVFPRQIFLPVLLLACGSSGATVGAADAQVADVRTVDAHAPQDAPAPADVQAAPDVQTVQDAGPDFCATPSPCPNDARLTPDDIMNCRASIEAQRGQPCAAENAAVNACRQQNIVCGGDGMTDFTATSERFNNACMTRAMARETCCATPAGMGSPNCI